MNPGSDDRHAKRQKVPSTMSRDEVDNQTIHAKIRRMLRPGYESLLDDSKFSLAPLDTLQLKSLQKEEAHPVKKDAGGAGGTDGAANVLVQSGAEEKMLQNEAAHDTANVLLENGDEENDNLLKYNITVDQSLFLDLTCQPERFYVREGYEELYKYVFKSWMTKDRYHVVLVGNAGTGKSWFQIYALKQLMCCDDRKFDIVIRQVDKRFYFIDLEEAVVYRWFTTYPEVVYEFAKGMERTLYFFEPGYDSTTPPLKVHLPSLSTLSPNIQRMQEYEKSLCKIVYFWPWSSGELRALIRDANLAIDEATFSDRYYKFGGILSHILGQNERAQGQLETRLKNINIIDRTMTGTNVSGFLVCYDNRSIQGEDRFAELNLEFTSAYVEEEVQNQIHARPMRESMAIVLDRLSGTKRDIAGKNLERAAMELLSQGRKLK